MQVTTYDGTFAGDPDAYFAGGLGINAFASSATGIATIAERNDDPGIEGTIAHEVGHATKAAFPRQDFGPVLDHSEGPGLMSNTARLPAFSAREVKILRGYKQP